MSRRQIQLTKGLVALVDESDYGWISKSKWYASKSGRDHYARRWVTDFAPVYMHREIAGAGPGQLVDHINGHTLDNRRENLRLANKSQNAANSRKRRNNSASNFKGVTWRSDTMRWTAQLCVGGKHISAGCYATDLEAAMAYDRAARAAFGEFALVNFSDEAEALELVAARAAHRVPEAPSARGNEKGVR